MIHICPVCGKGYHTRSNTKNIVLINADKRQKYQEETKAFVGRVKRQQEVVRGAKGLYP